ncbi:MAG: hypothetical protein GY711_09225 [bacterium]|nr:hypothetical protein [bacterium]
MRWQGPVSPPRIWHFARDGSLLGSFASSSPDDLTVAPDGTVWVVNSSGGVRHYATDGVLLGHFDTGFTGANHSLDLAPDGTIWSSIGSLVLHFEQDGTLIQSFPSGGNAHFLVGSNQGMVTPPRSAGPLCLACGFQGCSGIGRYSRAGEIIQGPTGSLQVDLTALPLSPMHAVVPGETWNFQLWHRDLGSSNFTDAISILFH